MKKLKLRFKKALFVFFKEEILEAVGYQREIHVNISKEFHIAEIKSQIIIDDRESYLSHIPPTVLYEKALEKAKKELFEQSMKFIKVDESSIVDQNIYGHRAIKVKLMVIQ